MGKVFETDQPIRIAQVGVGRRARAHLPVIKALHDLFELVAICDRDARVAESVAGEYGVPGYSSVRELLEREKLDAVNITVPGPAHHAVGCLAAAAGVHQIAETPIATTRALADLMIESSANAGVHLEVAENYYRAPMERFWSRVIDEAGVLGPVSRIWRIFQEGGHHGMSLLRVRAGSEPTRILGITHQTPVVPIIDRMERHHEQERMLLSYLDFASGAVAVMAYSNVIHARSLGRGRTSVSQVDGERGSIVDDTVYLVPEEELSTGAGGHGFVPTRLTHAVDSVEVLDAIELELPAPYGTLRWENPFRDYPLTERQVAVADELVSLGRAIRTGKPPEYGASAGRLDVEMNLAMQQSAASDRTTLDLPLPARTDVEDQLHEDFERKYGCAAFDVEKLADIMFPRT